ncbi:MAG: MerR family transcriptional regulator [Deinococcota bacterium]
MFKISEFSKIAQVPASLLRYYDKIGLFSPVHTDDINQYRYYDAKQLPELSRILALKELGLSLEQIANLVQDNVSADEIRGMFTLRKAQIEQSLQAEAARLKVVETRLKQLERSHNQTHEDIIIKSLPAQPFFSHRRVYASPFDSLATLMEMETHARPRFGKRAGHLVAVLHSAAFEMEDVDIEFGYVLTQPAKKDLELPSGQVLVPTELPAVETVACSVRVGGLENGYLNYGDLGVWLEQNNHNLGTPHREVMIVPPLPDRMDDAVVEIQLPLIGA